jgi:ribulose-phosphate 3-epimerase
VVVFNIHSFIHSLASHFVPNLTIGAPVVKSLRQHTSAVLDCHLMVSEPERWVNDFAKAGADQYTFHIEATKDPKALCAQIRAAGMHCGVSIKPATPASAIAELVSSGLVDTVLVMTVEPGFGGQSFMASMVPKIAEIRKLSSKVNIEVDGGIGLDNVEQVAAAGANVVVAGSAIFGASDPGAVIRGLKAMLDQHASARVE